MRAQFRERIFPKALLIALCAGALLGSLACDGENTTSPPTPPTPSQAAFDEALWRDPPMEYRPYVRWWWPGGNVDPEELKRELRLLQSAGFGGVEIFPLLFGLSPDEIEKNPAVRTVGTPEFFEKVRIAAEEARALGMGWDILLGSGWPPGGPFVSTSEKQLLMSSMDITGPALYHGVIPPPEPPTYIERVNAVMDTVGAFDPEAKLVAVTAARVADGSSQPPALDSFTDITGALRDGVLTWEVPEGEWKVFAFYENRTNHASVGAAFPGSWKEALVPDSLDAAGAGELIKGYGDPMLGALGGLKPGSIFVDSYEMVAELPWTSSFLDRFKNEKGYDLAPYLPLVFRERGESKYTTILLEMMGQRLEPVYVSSEIGPRIREDYEEVRSEMFLEGTVIPLRDWAHRNGLTLRMQAHGGWADYLDAYGMVDIPESEGLFAGGSYDFLKMASSGAHTAGHRLVSQETFVALADPHGLTLEDFYLLAGRSLSAGINRIIYHGFPYVLVRENGAYWHPVGGDEGTVRPGPLSFASRISEDHPVWPRFPEFNRYLARLSYAMSLGEHRADVAWLQPEWHVPDRVIANAKGFPSEQGESAVSLALKRAGFVYDRVSRNGLTSARIEGDRFSIGSAEYRGLLITDLDAASPELMASIESLAEAGIPIVVLGKLPERATGFADYEERDATVRAIAGRLGSVVSFVEDENEVGRALRMKGVRAFIEPADGRPMPFAVERRGDGDRDIVLLFNESNESRTEMLALASPAKKCKVLNPQTGEEIHPATLTVGSGSGVSSLEVTIAPHRSLVLVSER